MEQAPILDEKSFYEKYWFDNSVHVTVSNPDTQDFIFKMVVAIGIDRATGKPREEHKTFMVPAGGKERYVGSVANLYLDMMSKYIAQKEGKIADITDWKRRAEYFDDLIVDIDDPFADNTFVPYTDVSGDARAAEVPAEMPFAAAVAQDEEKQRLERENEELKAKLAVIEDSSMTPEETKAAIEQTTGVPTVFEGRSEQQPFAAVAGDAPKHAGGRPRKIQG